MNVPTYPTDRSSIIARGLVNMRGQVKSIQGELDWTQRKLTEYAEDPLYSKRIPEFQLRVTNLTDALCVLALYIELGEAEQKRMKHQPSLFEEVSG